ncbi:MAG: PorP/SprF family type IX secretion system membrane protein [Bacteroidetes bacterium]|nr:PorP/SprF family type IX secretion system membrane protein [Bacteroidota bacterium]MBU1720779.1 PorP/SprF family type IX secretion system membrane protein [Bacteroidota bacterium]
MKTPIRIIIRRVYILAFILAVPALQSGNAQMSHYSLGSADNMYINPANTGNYDGIRRISLMYRSQWDKISVPFTYKMISFEKPFFVYSEKFNLGVSLQADQSGTAGFRSISPVGYLSYYKEMGKSTVAVGFCGGMVHQSFSLDGLTNPGQFNYETGYFDASMENAEPDLSMSHLFPLAGFGLLWKRQTENWTPQFGFSMVDITKPRVMLYGLKKRIEPAYSGHVSLQYKPSSQYEANLFGIIRQRGKENEVLCGVNGLWHFISDEKKNPAFMAGVSVRRGGFSTNDALIWSTGLQYGRWTGRISYDHTISRLKKLGKMVGSTEISLVYTAPPIRSSDLSKPCKRYSANSL